MNRRSPLIRLVLIMLVAISAAAQSRGGELRFCLRSEPKTFNPLLVADDASETVRYLTGGVLIRVNRQTQAPEPELATAWKISKDGRSITFTLRDKVFFSDGTPFSAEDVVATVRQMMDAKLHSPTGDAFRSGPGEVAVKVLEPNRVTITFPAAVAGLDRQFDQVAMMSAKSPKKEMAVLGPFYLADYKPGSYVLLKRNPNYWKKDEGGRPLPYLDSARLEIQSNRDIETLRFRRGELDLINSIDAEYYDRIAQSSPALVRDAGPSLDSEQMWFNQVTKSPIAKYKIAWFRSQNFRRAVSEAINRDDLARVAFSSHARPAIGPVSPANRVWFNANLKPSAYNTGSALQRLQKDGFRLERGVLRDKDGHEVEFSIVTNSGNRYRERMATMIQQDLSKIGMKVNVVTLDFPSLIDRMTQSFNYEAALLGLTNVDPDPNAQMTVWLSSGDNHQWNPGQKSPETPWEAEIDRLMRRQASAVDFKARKAAFDRVQEIVAEQAPFLYLVNKNALAAISTAVQGAAPVVLRPQTYWNIERLTLKAGDCESAAMNTHPFLSLCLSVDYATKPGVLREARLEVREGEVMGLIGHSGSGKSTIALSILRLLALKGGKASGSAYLRGRDLMLASEREMRAVRGQEVGLVLQSPLSSLNPALRIGTQLGEAWRAHANGASESCRQALREALRSVSLPEEEEFLKRRPSQLSVGQAQRVLIAMAILHRPPLLIADEPTSALDPITQAEILALFAQLNRERNMAILYISHDLLSVASICHRIAILHEGEIVECAPPQQVFNRPTHPYTQRLVAALPLAALGHAQSQSAASARKG